jgi:imidazolonepropionase-like amidohydrolase
MVDCHSHLTLPGGAHWIERGFDPPETLRRVAERNGALLNGAGVRWARDVGSPPGDEATAHGRRAAALSVRDSWRGQRGRPYVRAAGTWLARSSALPPGLAIDVDDGDGLRAAALAQLDDGADLVKLYLDGPDPETSPFSVDEVAAVVAACRARGAKATAHATRLSGTRVCAAAGVDAIEHGFELDQDVAAQMAASGIHLVSTLTVLRSWETFATTTRLPRFSTAEGRRRIAARGEAARRSVAIAQAAGVVIAAGSDFGGGSSRANHLPWEVEALVEAGLEPWQALAAATWHGGVVLGEPDAGTIGEGGPADFFLVHGDPLSDPAALWRVWRTAWDD